MLDATHDGFLAERFGLGRAVSLRGPVAVGRLGEVWQLTTDRGRFAVKHAQSPVSIADAEHDAAYQGLVLRAGVPLPAVVRTVDDEVVAAVDSGHVRVYEWVDVLPADRRLDPVEVGRLLATIHAVEVPSAQPVDGWYVDPIGSEPCCPPSWRQRASSRRRAGCRSVTGTSGRTM